MQGDAFRSNNTATFTMGKKFLKTLFFGREYIENSSLNVAVIKC
jgi:hypothetical protein